MANILDELLIKLGFVADTSEAEKFNSKLGDIIKTTAKIGAAITATGAVFTAVVGKGIIDTASEFEQFETQLTTIEGSAEKAKKSLDWIADFGARTPYDVAQVTDAFVKLKAYGLDPIENDLLESLGNTASAMGKSLEQSVEAIADAVRGENERLKEFGIVGSLNGNKVSYTYDYNGESFTKEVNKDTKEIQQALQEIFDQKFDGGMIALSKTWEGMLSNMGDQWTDFKRTIGEEGVFDTAKDSLRGILTYLNDNTEAIRRLAVTFGFFISAVFNVVGLILAPFVLLAKAVIAVNNAVVWFLQLINNNIILKTTAIFIALVTAINLLASSMAVIRVYMAFAIAQGKLWAATMALANSRLIILAKTAVTNALLATKSFIAMARAMTLAQMRAMAWQYVVSAMTAVRLATTALTARIIALNTATGFTSKVTLLLTSSLNTASLALSRFSLVATVTTVISKTLITVLTALRVAVIALRTSLAVLLSPLGLIIASVGAFLLIVEDLYHFFKGNDSLLGKLAEDSPALALILESIGDVIKEFKVLLASLANSGSELSGTILSSLGSMSSVLAVIVKALVPALILALKVLTPTLKISLSVISMLIKAISVMLITFMKITDFFTSGFVSAFKSVAFSVKDIWATLFGGLLSIFNSVFDVIINKLGIATDIIGGVVRVIGSVVTGDFGGAIEAGIGTVGGVGRRVFSLHSNDYNGSQVSAYDGREAVKGKVVNNSNAVKSESNVTQTINVTSAEEASLIASRTAQATRQHNLGYM